MKELILLKHLILGYSKLRLLWYKTRVEFNGSCSRQDSVTFNHWKIVTIYIVYEISKSINSSDYLTLENCLSGAVTLTKNANINKHKYSGYENGFHRHGSFSFPGTGLGRNVIIFGGHQLKLITGKKIF